MKITVRKSGEIVVQKETDASPLHFGRSSTNDIVLADPDVSRRHARLSTEDGKLILEDLQSFNGTKLRGQPVVREEIGPGDSFRIGPFEISVEEEISPEPNKVLKSFLTSESQPAMTARLVRLDGERAGEEIPLDKEKTDVGAEEDVCIVRKENSFILKSGPEATATFVDGVPVHERELENHDVLRIGESEFEYMEGESRCRIEETAGSRLFAILSDWKVLAAGGALAGIALAAVLPFNRILKTGGTGIKPPSAASPAPETTGSETERLVLHHLKKAREAVRIGKLEEAETHLKLILNSLSPGHAEARKLAERIGAIRAEAERQRKEAERKETERRNRISDLLSQGDLFLQKKKLAEAKDSYRKALDADPGNERAEAALEQIASVEKKQKQAETARKKRREEIKKIYKAGVTRLEAGELGAAEKLLSEVAAAEGPYQTQARTMIAEIHTRTDKKLAERIGRAKIMLEKGDLIAAHDDLEKIVRQFPGRKDAADLFMKAQVKMLEKAKAAYAQGVAEQQLAEDPAAALDKFHEVLKYAPDPASEYHRKAQKKIKELQLSPE